LVSQTLSNAEQWAQGGSQEATMHTPPTHVDVACGKLQTLPHAPQLFTSVFPLMLQPVVILPSQLRKPGLQFSGTQTPFVHIAVPLSSVQTALHVPQFLGSVSGSTSHPSLTTPLQSSKPGSHIPIAHLPPLQLGVAFGVTHALLHMPQFIGSVWPLMGQPSDGGSLQLR
jgi:hypothetical protein